MIRFYRNSDQSAVIDLVLRIQNGEYQVGLTLTDQPDLNSINACYHGQGGAFWVAEQAGVIVGCVGLMRLSAEVGVLKKFFVESAFRGQEKGVSAALFSALICFATEHGFSAIVLDTPAVATRSHAFYRRAGFRSISKAELPVPYEYPDRDSRLFMLALQPPRLPAADEQASFDVRTAQPYAPVNTSGVAELGGV